MLAIATDIHVDKDNIPEVDKSLEFLLLYLVEKEINTLILLGDLFTDRTGQTLETLLFWKRKLRKFSDNGIETHIIPGNHDKTDLESEDSYVSLFEDIPGIHVYPAGGIIVKENYIYALLPYFKETGSYISRLKALCKEVEKAINKHKPEMVYLGTHIAVDQVRNNDGSLVENNIKPSLFKLFTRIHIGHYHNEQDIDEYLSYIGSLQPKDFGENNEKGFLVINSDFEEIRVKPNFKKYIKITLDLDDASREHIAKMREKYANSIHNVRFIFKGTVEQLETVDKKWFNEVGIDVKKNSKSLLKSIKAASEGEIASFTKQTITKNFMEFCKQNSIEGRRIPKGFKYIKAL
jgi:DNA repair exonuclease SbcCD nuclease subunit